MPVFSFPRPLFVLLAQKEKRSLLRATCQDVQVQSGKFIGTRLHLCGVSCMSGSALLRAYIRTYVATAVSIVSTVAWLAVSDWKRQSPSICVESKVKIALGTKGLRLCERINGFERRSGATTAVRSYEAWTHAHPIDGLTHDTQ